nr:hypothetical protein [Tanacetum cinerariifolium]
MAKKDMDLYHSRLTQDDLNDLVIKYKIPRDLHPQLPSKEFVMSELLDDAIALEEWLFLLIGGLFRMIWFGGHPKAAIDDPRSVACSFNMADVRRLIPHVVKLRDMPESVLVLSGLSRVWKSRICDLVLRGADGNGTGTVAEVQEEPHLDIRPTLQRLPFYCTPPAATDVVLLGPAPEDLAVGTPSFKIVAKAEVSQKRKASTSGVASSHVAKRTSDDDDGDDDACVEISLVTPLHSADVIPSSGNQGRSSVAPAAEDYNTRDSRGKDVMVDDDAASSAGMSQPRPSSRPAPSFRDVSDGAIHTDFFPFFASPYYATYPEDGVTGNCEFTREEWDAPYQPTFGALTKEMSVLHCMMMSHGGKLLACYRGLNQSHHEYVLSTDSRLKGYEEKVASLTGLELQVSTLKKQVYGLNDKLSTSDASFAKSKAKGKEMKKKIKSLTKSLDNFHYEVARLFVALNQAAILEAERDEEILWLKAIPSKFSSFFRGQFDDLVRKFLASDEFSRVQDELLSLAASAGFESRAANVPASKDARVSPPIAKKLTVTPASKFLELPTNVAPTPHVVASEQNEKWVNAMVDGPDAELTDDAAHSKSGGVFVHGTSHVLDDVAGVTVVGSERFSSGLTDVVVALSTGEKGDGSLPSSAADEEATANLFGV